MHSTPFLGMMAAAALSASAGLGNAVEVSRPEQGNLNLPVPPPRWLPKRRVKRLNARVQGGNWQGMPYLSYAEHDQCVRATFGAKTRDEGNLAYFAERQRIILNR